MLGAASLADNRVQQRWSKTAALPNAIEVALPRQDPSGARRSRMPSFPLSPPHLVTWSPGHLVTLSSPSPLSADRAKQRPQFVVPESVVPEVEVA